MMPTLIAPAAAVGRSVKYCDRPHHAVERRRPVVMMPFIPHSLMVMSQDRCSMGCPFIVDGGHNKYVAPASAPMRKHGSNTRARAARRVGEVYAAVLMLLAGSAQQSGGLPVLGIVALKPFHDAAVAWPFRKASSP